MKDVEDDSSCCSSAAMLFKRSMQKLPLTVRFENSGGEGGLILLGGISGRPLFRFHSDDNGNGGCGPYGANIYIRYITLVLKVLFGLPLVSETTENSSFARIFDC